ncbi:MAG: hypothetical protein IBJ18_12030 [Phycisphaerales bacterium]|nr:hypothetical protein [Phycisphaerales bacterium]
MKTQTFIILIGIASLTLGACTAKRDQPPASTAQGTPAPLTPSTQAAKPAPSPAPTPPTAPSQAPAPGTSTTKSDALREVFPHVRVDTQEKIVEIDAIVPIDARDPQTPNVFLEVVLCTADSKEHESLVMTRARASHVHAALLLIGLQPGSPGRVEWTPATKDTPAKATRIAPTGDDVEITFRWEKPASNETAPTTLTTTPTTVTESPWDWIETIDAKSSKRASIPQSSRSQWLFAGSSTRTNAIINERGDRGTLYAADTAGTLIGLTTFGTETLALSQVLSPESSIDEPLYLASTSRTPKVGTKVVVEIRKRKSGNRQ